MGDGLDERHGCRGREVVHACIAFCDQHRRESETAARCATPGRSVRHPGYLSSANGSKSAVDHWLSNLKLIKKKQGGDDLDERQHGCHAREAVHACVRLRGLGSRESRRPHVCKSYIACTPRQINRRSIKLRVVPFGSVLDSRTTTSQNCEAVPRRAHI